ncbi:MAG: FAD-dependent oxidoreductase [Candidatus Accumulibacter sp.]|nr:FAD-dependent oxidoreductase [Candidatus Accumulibacter necessarius]
MAPCRHGPHLRTDCCGLPPDCRTTDPRVILAGDYTWPDYPAALEGTVRSGRRAALLALAVSMQDCRSLPPFEARLRSIDAEHAAPNENTMAWFP